MLKVRIDPSIQSYLKERLGLSLDYISGTSLFAIIDSQLNLFNTFVKLFAILSFKNSL